MKLFTAAILISGAIASSAFGAPEFIPVVNGHFTTGQWYFEGEQSSLAGNMGLTVVPAMRFSNRFSLVPTIESSYRGTRSAEELAGGNNLFQDTWENGISLKAVHGLTRRWKIRERIGYRMKWFRETTDETWNNGLYDYRVANIGAEAEHRWSKRLSVAAGYDFSMLEFPNYVSLESTQPGDLAREFSGDDVLDARIHLFSLRAETPMFWGIGNNVQIFHSPRRYASQHVVELTGLLSATEREDTYTGFSLGLERPFDLRNDLRLIGQIQYGYTSLDSNQNHYDARLTTFIPDFYNYDQHLVGGLVTLGIGKNANGPMTIDTGYTYSRRDYSSRVTQSLNGDYSSEKLYVEETAFSLGFGYPITKNIRARASSTFGRSRSNNDYELVYRYNYTNSNYQFGFTYEY